MTKLTDTQIVILGAAAQHDDRNVLPLPGSLRGGAAARVVGALLSRGLIAETATDSQTRADAALNRIWRNDEDGRAILLHITDAGLEAIGVEPDSAPVGAAGAEDEAPHHEAAAGEKAATPAAQGRTGGGRPKLRAGTKQAALIAMLEAPEGATVDEIAVATGWQPHTVRGAIAGALKKRLGLTVVSDKVDGRGRVYRIAG